MLKVDLKIVESDDGVSFDEAHIKLLKEGAVLLEKIVNDSDSFEKKVTGKGLRRPKRFRRSNGLSRTEVYNVFMSGDDKFTEESSTDSNVQGDMDIDIWIHPYKTKPGVVGYTTPSTHATWINLNKLYQWMNRYNNQPNLLRAEIAGNLAHEYCHNLGFRHGRGGSTRANRKTVPYFIGNTVRDIGRNEANLFAIGNSEDLFACSESVESK
ncbi:hypothetical protein [Roseivirga misakiensis]|uniref:Uncharacterized protein n=1 Tax=Roseivirga misakiensis TaxID=1563681 RepID=A0A1E5SZY1_9BACT|nr:hypothetical protein [Roseivirga misakiensis]OEK04680.1 hypothetical protein BFP71_14600 [Roseivirga misakiensis]